MNDLDRQEGEAAASAGMAAHVMERLIAAADVSRVYGPAIEHGERLMIPAAELVSIAGFGMGSGSGIVGAGSVSPRRGGGGGGGGGGKTFARSVAVVVSSPDGVEIRPVVDVTKIALAALTAVGFVWAAWKKTAEPRGFFGR